MKYLMYISIPLDLQVLWRHPDTKTFIKKYIGNLKKLLYRRNVVLAVLLVVVDPVDNRTDHEQQHC
jgi:hypothetical protein